MENRFKKFIIDNPKLKKVIGVILILWGIFALLTPFTPGSWLAFIGLELLGVELLFLEKIKAWFRNKNTNNYFGDIIEESLENKSTLERVKIISSEVEAVTERHRTPWLTKWTIHSVEVSEFGAVEIAELLSKSLESDHAWYADFKNKKNHYIIFRGKIFFINRRNRDEYKVAREYGLSLGIPEYQVNFEKNVI